MKGFYRKTEVLSLLHSARIELDGMSRRLEILRECASLFEAKTKTHGEITNAHPHGVSP